MKTQLVIIIALIISISIVYACLKGPGTPSLTPTITPTPSPIIAPTRSYTILDFEEAIKFNSIEETKNYRFKMSVGKDYQVQEYWVYQYLGDGKIRIKDFSDPDFVREFGYIVYVGCPFNIGFVPPAKGRHYEVMTIEVGSRDLIFRIEKIMGDSA